MNEAEEKRFRTNRITTNVSSFQMCKLNAIVLRFLVLLHPFTRAFFDCNLSMCYLISSDEITRTSLAQTVVAVRVEQCENKLNQIMHDSTGMFPIDSKCFFFYALGPAH